MSRYGIQLRNVIGHNESLTSPYHHELYRAWRCQTHGDWTPCRHERLPRPGSPSLARRYRRPARAGRATGRSALLTATAVLLHSPYIPIRPIHNTEGDTETE